MERWQNTPDSSGRRSETDEPVRCDACGADIEGEPAGRGLLVFPRGDEVLREEPPLCERCALAIGMTALDRWEMEEEDG
jgi:hypothetical protein